MPTISILSGGAAQALVKTIEPAFAAAHGYDIAGVFGAVGAMRARLAAGPAPDVVILTAAIIAELADAGTVMRDTITDIGDVETAVAIKDGDRVPDVADAAALRTALLAADAIYVPDTKLSTAGIHVAGVLDKLGIAAEIASRLRTFPNGATAMAALAQAPEASPIGCTQVTEIMATPGARLVAALPAGLGLKTRYTAAVTTGAHAPEAARAFVSQLASSASAAARRQAGFV